jgi:hypothetical protein
MTVTGVKVFSRRGIEVEGAAGRAEEDGLNTAKQPNTISKYNIKIHYYL